MGSAFSQQIKSNQTVVTDILQKSQQSCRFSCDNNVSNVDFIIENNSGDIIIKQQCAIQGTECIMTSTLDSTTETILKSMLEQSTSAMNGFALNFSASSQDIRLEQLIQNTITQTMLSSCDFYASDNINDVYFYITSNSGDIFLEQNSSISNSTCNMNNSAKNTTYNEATTEASQSAKVTTVAALIFGILIICMILGAVMMIVFSMTGMGKGGNSNADLVKQLINKNYTLQADPNMSSYVPQEQSTTNMLSDFASSDLGKSAISKFI